jgi:hypothetical protein
LSSKDNTVITSEEETSTEVISTQVSPQQGKLEEEARPFENVAKFKIFWNN